MRRILNFLRRYKLLSIALLSLIAALVLQATGQTSTAHLVLGVASILELLPIAWGMWQDVRAGSYSGNFLAILTVIAAVLLKQYWTALAVILAVMLNVCFEDFARYKNRNALDRLLEKAPQKALLVKKGKTLEVKVSELKAGDKIIVKAGEVVPVDSLILVGRSSFDESVLRGESQLKSCQAGEKILGGAVNIDEDVTAKVIASAVNSQYQQVIRLVQGAANSQAQITRLASLYSLPFTCLAAGAAVVTWVLSGHPIRFLEVLVVATPYPLLLSAPIALTGGMSRASRYGIFFKTGSAFENLARARTIAFDKTGTLTHGQPEVVSVAAYGAFTETGVLKLAASLEQGSNHPVANAILTAATEQKIKPLKAKSVREIPGQGLQAILKGQTVLVGRAGFLEQADIQLTSKARSLKSGQTVIYVAVEGQLAGTIAMIDALQPEAITAIERLDLMGIKNIDLFTGDSEAAAMKTTASLKIGRVHAEVLPADKIHIIEHSSQRPLVFVGDGISDVAALTAADVGVALGIRGSTAASEPADLSIMESGLGGVTSALSVAKQALSLARQGVLMGLFLTIVLMALFATGKFSALEGAILQEIVNVFVILNALRALLIEPQQA